MTVAVVLMEPATAMIVVVPSATEVTRPADETVATSVAVEAHVTVALAITVPTASFTVAASVVVSPNEVKLTLVGDSVTEVAT